MYRNVSVAGLKVSNITKVELISEIEKRIQGGKQTKVFTPYSEFLYSALLDKKVLSELNQADFSVPDGVGVMWAERFLSKPFVSGGFYQKVIEGFFQIVFTGAQILLSPGLLKKVFPEKIVGADLFWELADLADKNNLSVFLAGGFGDTPEIVAKKLKAKFPGINIVGKSNRESSDPELVGEVESSGAEVIFAALGPIKQEEWINKNADKLKFKLAIGLGGTFDYVAGKVSSPPAWIRKSGLEWFYRLFTQPKRFKRIWNATYGLCEALLRYKVFQSMPYRKNVVTVVMNKENRILVCKRNPHQRWAQYFGKKHAGDFFKNYWQMPQGGIGDEEDVLEAAKRELYEETGIQSVGFVKFSEQVNRYDWQNAKRRLWGNPGKFRGQEQKIAYFTFTGEDREVALDEEELVEFKWVVKEDLLSVLHEERQSVGEIVVGELENNFQN